jgi:5-methylcytosine-specific restriction protein A
MPKDYRTPEATENRKLYKTPRWKTLRRVQLHNEPLCERCKLENRVTSAEVVHHRKPHKGSPSLFFDPANLESLCKYHHDSHAQQQERIGYSKDIGIDGMPTDPNHPWAS